MFKNHDEILSLGQLIDLLGVKKNTIYKLLNSGEIKSFKIGKQHMVTRQSLNDYIVNKQNEDWK